MDRVSTNHQESAMLGTYLVPVLLHASLSSSGEGLATSRQFTPAQTGGAGTTYLGDVAPGAPGIPHGLEPLLFGGRPWRVGPGLLGWVGVIGGGVSDRLADGTGVYGVHGNRGGRSLGGVHV